MNDCNLPKQFSDKWLKEFRKALEAPNFKVKSGKAENYKIDDMTTVTESGKWRKLTTKERNNLLIARSLILD